MRSDERARILALLRSEQTRQLRAEEAALAKTTERDLVRLERTLHEAPTELIPDIRSTEDFIAVLQALHAATIDAILAGRGSPRKTKARQRKHLVQGSLSAATGTGLLVTNAINPAMFPVSFALSVAALVQAARDVVDYRYPDDA